MKPFGFAVEGDDRRVSLAVYAADGSQVRTLLSGVEMERGFHEFMWDGRDRLGRPMPAGEYTWRMLAVPGFTARFIGPLGANPGHDEPYGYGFGNLGPPRTVAVADGVMIVSASAENVPATFCQTVDGQRVLWRHGYSSHPVLLKARIIDERVIAYAYDIWHRTAHALVLDLHSGRQLQRFDIQWEADGRQHSSAGYRMATDGRHMAVGYPNEELIVVYNLETGEIERERAGVADMRDLEYGDGILHVLADASLLREVNGAFETVIADGQLTRPWTVAWDASCGEWLIGERVVEDTGGQVKRFDRKGRLLAAYGRAGGRRCGAWSPGNFDEINGLAAFDDGSGAFLLAEGGAAVRRTVHVNADGGVVREWFGPQEFYNFSASDPGDPERIIFLGGSDSFSIARFDYDSGEWTMLESYKASHIGDLFPATDHYSVRWWPRRRNGKLYLETDAGHAGILRVDSQAGKLTPVATAGPIKAKHPILLAAAESQQLDLNAMQGFIWTDSDGTGQIDSDEIVFTETPMPSGLLHIDDAWNVIWRSRYWRATDPEPAWHELPNLDAGDDADFPRWEQSHLSSARLPNAAVELAGSGTDVLLRDAEGATYMLMNGNRAGGDRHGDQWPTMVLGSVRLIRWRADGALDWVVGQGAVEGRFVPGRFHEATGLPGFAHGNLVVADKSFGPAVAYTPDGLYAGSFLDHRADDGLPGAAYVWFRDPRTGTDSPIPYDCRQGGSVVERDGRVFWLPMGNQYTPVYEISGWNGWQRAEGKLSLPPQDTPLAEKGEGLSGEVFPSATFTGDPVEVETSRLWCVPGPAGRVQPGRVDWSSGPAAGIDPDEPFSIRWRGQMEAKFSESWRLTVYNHDVIGSTTGPGWKRDHGQARVWLGGIPVIDTATGLNTSRWMTLDAGRHYDLRVEFVHDGGTAPEFSLCWESTTQERQRIPSRFLHRSAMDERPTLRLVRNGDSVTVAASRPTDSPLTVRLAVNGQDDALAEPVPRWLTLETGQSETHFTVQWKEALDTFARVNIALEPVAGWTVAPTDAEVVFLQSAQSDLFMFDPDDTVVMTDDLADPAPWGILRKSGRFSDGAFGPTVASDGRPFTAWRSLPMDVDLKRNVVVLYLRARTPGHGYGGHVSMGLTGHWLGLRVIRGQAMNVYGRTTHHAQATIGRFDARTQERQKSGEAVDYRVAFSLRDGSPYAEAYILDEAGQWSVIGESALRDHRDQAQFLTPPPGGRIEIGGRNGEAGYIDAAAVALRPLDEPQNQSEEE